MLKQLLILLLFLISCYSTVYSQISRGGSPYTLQSKLPKISSREIIAAPSNLQRVVLKSSGDSIWHKTLKFAQPIKTNYTPDNSGQWTTLGNDTRVWRLPISSKGALSLNLIFTKFRLPEGARLFIFSPDGSQVLGAYTSANNKSSKILPTMPIIGDELIVEYSEPGNVSFRGELEIGRVNYDFLGINKALKSPNPGEFGASEACEEEASCFDLWETERKGVVKIIVDGTELCSGALIANTSNDNTPLVLSASHCFEDYGYQASTAIFIFNYDCPNCLSNIEGSREQSIAGGYMRAYSETEENKDLDYALVEMSLPTPPSYDAYFCGWDLRDLEGKETTTIHHPSGDVKKLSVDFDSIRSITLIVDGFKFLSGGHWQIFNWDIGTTEGGSSGAPLFNKSHRIIGGLSAGSATCANPIDDFFFKLSKAWDAHPTTNQRLKYWLDPDNTGKRYMDGYKPSYGTRIETLTNVKLNDSLNVIKLVDENSFGYQTGDNSFSIKKYAERFSADDSFKVLGFYFVPFMGENSVLTPITFKIWEGDQVPEKELWSQKLVLKEWIRRQRVDISNFGTSGGYYIKSDYQDKVCFINVPELVEAENSIFIGYEMSESTPNDTFAMYQAMNRLSEDPNTAYFYVNNEWKPFTQYPAQASRSSLWINAVIEFTSITTDSTPPEVIEKKLIQSLIPSNNRRTYTVRLFGEATEKVKVEGFSINGTKVHQELIVPEAKSFVFTLNNVSDGVYLLRFTQLDKQQTLKVVVVPGAY